MIWGLSLPLMPTSTLPDKRYIILILGALMTLSPFSIDMYLPAFPQIARDFGTTPARIALSVSSYFIGLAFGQLLYGPLLDRFGRKRPLYIGLTTFLVASLACMQTTSVEVGQLSQADQAAGLFRDGAAVQAREARHLNAAAILHSQRQRASRAGETREIGKIDHAVRPVSEDGEIAVGDLRHGG